VCQVAPPVSFEVETLAVHDLRAAESRLTDLTVVRRRDRALAPIRQRITADMRYVFLRERDRVLDILRVQRLPYSVGREALAAGLPQMQADTMMRVLLNGIDSSQYAAVLEDCYRAATPKGMDAAMRLTLDAAGVPYRVDSLGNMFLSNGVRLVRFRGAETWIRDHAIQFGRRWAESVKDKTNVAIRSQLAQGFAEFESIDQLMKRVRGVYSDASAYRAEMISRTETSRAYNEATTEMGRRLGVEGKYWILSGSPYSYTDECADNAAAGTIAVDAEYPSGVACPPAHPNCECSEGLEVPDDFNVPPEFQVAA